MYHNYKLIILYNKIGRLNGYYNIYIELKGALKRKFILVIFYWINKGKFIKNTLLIIEWILFCNKKLINK